MKNLKVYRKAFAILTVSTLVLMTGCGKSEDKKKEPKIEPCEHLTIYFEDQPITFKECEGYELDTYAGASSGVCHTCIRCASWVFMRYLWEPPSRMAEVLR